MTQKELSYVEDAVGHEKAIIKIINNSIENLDDSNLTSFMNSELKKHKKIEERLLNLLEEKNG